MAEVWVMGELLCEIMRPEENMSLYEPGPFVGPYPSGAPGIFISTVARMGRSAGIISGVGRDDFGKCILDRLNKDGVDCSHVLESDTNSTGVAFVAYQSNGDRQFIYHMGNTPAVEAKAPDVGELSDAKFFHVMGCSLMADRQFGEEILKTARSLHRNGTKISFDPNIRPELMNTPSALEIVKEIWNISHVFMPGVEELKMITGEQSVEDAVRRCFENENLEILALKNGSKGTRIITRDEDFAVGIYKVESVDPTGAGDSFDGAFIASLLSGDDVHQAAKNAAAAGALNVMAFGPMEGDISPETVRDLIGRSV